MSRNKRAFTLIEVLVVVLIIAILAAIALPQYQKAVWKARYAQTKILTVSLAEAMELYYLAEGHYTACLSELDISINTTSDLSCTNDIVAKSYHTEWGYCNLKTRGEVGCTVLKNGSAYMRHSIFLSNSTYLPGKTYCFAYSETGNQDPVPSDLNYKLCQTESGSSRPAPSWSGGGALGFLYAK